MKPKYPDGIDCMDDYLGAIVALREAITTRGGKQYPAGMVLIVKSHWRGRLTLATYDRAKGLAEPGSVVIIGADRHAVDVRWLRLA